MTKQHPLIINPGKSLSIVASNHNSYQRFAIKTHFICRGEDYLDILRTYALPHYQPGDILALSEKMISICQNHVREIQDIKISHLARRLCARVEQTPAGEAMGNPYKLQAALDLVGWPRILLAALLSVIGKKIFRRKGWFYLVAGKEVAGIDGVCADAFPEYLKLIILNPIKPDQVCRQIYSRLGMRAMIMDANDLGVEILGKSPDLKDKKFLQSLVADNPAGQSNEQTPIILIRAVSSSPPNSQSTTLTCRNLYFCSLNI